MPISNAKKFPFQGPTNLGDVDKNFAWLQNRIPFSTGLIDADAIPSLVAALTLVSDGPTVVGTSYANAAPSLNISVTSGNPTRFQYYIAWVADAITTGAAFSLDGPAFTLLAYRSSWGDIPGIVNYSGTSYDQAFTASTASSIASNIAMVEGLIVPSADGSLRLRSHAEVVGPGSVTVKAGSSVLYF